MTSSYLNYVLADKLPDSSEVEIHLFEFCNLACAFCGQDHDSTVGMDEASMLAKADHVIRFMRDSGSASHIVNLMGGELFNDEVPDVLFSYYSAFHQRVLKWCREHGHTVRFNWVTNLVFKQLDRVVEFVATHECSYISTSYDFAGRGLDINRSLLFKRNLDALKDRITVIGFVLTRPAIRKLLADRDRGFKELYGKYTLYFDFYVPELSADKLMPSEQECLDAYRFIAEHYPNVYPVKDWLENPRNRMTCYSLNKLTLLPGGREVKCRYMDYEPTEFESEIDYQSNENIIQAFLDRKGCLSCDHYERCSLGCFVNNDWAANERLGTCHLRTFFNEHPLTPKGVRHELLSN